MSLELEQVVGPVTRADGFVDGPVRVGREGEATVTDAHGRYYEANRRGSVFLLSGTALAPTAYVGAGAGTPLLAIHNPVTSGKILELLAVGFAHRVGGSAAGATTLAAWSGVSAQPTGTQTVPRNSYSQQQAGSTALGFVNTALTGSTALNLALPLWGYQIIGATPVSQAESPGLLDVAGLVIAVPGNQIAVGLTVAVASLTADIAMLWEETVL